MNARRKSGVLSRIARPGWPVLAAAVVFMLSFGTAAHNHGVFGSDVGAEKVSQSQVTCPACMFDGRPVTVVTETIVICDAGPLAFVPPAAFVFEEILESTSASRAPPVS
jgi:hypothetical protein